MSSRPHSSLAPQKQSTDYAGFDTEAKYSLGFAQNYVETMNMDVESLAIAPPLPLERTVLHLKTTDWGVVNGRLALIALNWHGKIFSGV